MVTFADDYRRIVTGLRAGAGAAVLRWGWLLAPLLVVAVVVAGAALVPTGPAPAASEIVLGQGGDPQELVGRALLLRDETGTLGVEDVAGLAPGAFRPLDRALAAGFDKAAYWLRFSARRAPGAGAEWWLQVEMPYLDRIDLYTAMADGFVRQAQGDHLPASNRLLTHRDFIFPLPVPADGVGTYYLRVQSTSTLAVEARIWSPAGLAGQAGLDGLWVGALTGAAVIVVLLALVQWLLLRDAAYAYFALYVAALGAMHVSVNGLWPLLGLGDRPALADALVGISICLAAAAGSAFILHILDLPRRYPRTAWLYRLFGIACIAMAASVPFGGYAAGVGPAIHLAGLAANLGSCVVAFDAGRRGDLMARRYLLAWSFYLTGISLITLRNLGLIPSSPVVDWSPQVGTLIQVLLLGIGLAERVGQVEADRRAAQEALLEASRRAESELSVRVAERTQALTEANVAMEQALASEREARTEQRNFFAMVSHEFRTPLAVVGTAAQLVGMSPQSAQDADELDKIQRAVRRMTDLMDSCLTEEWVETAIAAVRDEALDLDRLLPHWIDEKRRISGRRIDLASDGPAPCRGDPVLLGIALSNLVDNAVKYSAAGSAIRVRLSRQGPWLSLAVCNRGGGVAAEVRQRIFEKFFRAPGHERISGAGLGLHVVQRIVAQHLGRVDLDSEPGGETRFTLILPAAA